MLYWAIIIVVASSTRIFIIFDEKSGERYFWFDWTTHWNFELSKDCHRWSTHAKTICSLPCWASFSPSTWWYNCRSLTARATISESALWRWKCRWKCHWHWHWPVAVHFGSHAFIIRFLHPWGRWTKSRTKSRIQSSFFMVRNVQKKKTSNIIFKIIWNSFFKSSTNGHFKLHARSLGVRE